MAAVKGPDSTEVLSEWIRTYEKDLLRLCCMYLRDVTLAEDAVQETFLKAYRHLPSFHGDSSPKTWLVRIAINVCKDIRRRTWFRVSRESVALDTLCIAAPEGSYEVRSELVAEIMRLPAMYKEVILLYYYEGFNQTEIAEALHVSVSTVHRRLEKAYSLLKIELKGGSIHES